MTDKSQQNPIHWSKDFVEHLRSVHFALIAVSAGLILLVLSSKQYNAVTALVQIEEILELKKQWSPTWLMTHFEGTVSELNLSPKPPALKDISVSDKGFRGVATWNDPSKGTQTLMFSFPEMNSSIITREYPKDNAFPKTLDQFSFWWNILPNSHVYIPISISAIGEIGHLSISAKEETGHQSSDPVNSKGHKNDTLTTIYTGPTETFTRDASFELQALSKTDEQTAIPLHFEYNSRNDTPSGYVATTETSEKLKIPITRLVTYDFGQSAITRWFGTLHPGSFEETFSDLSRATTQLKDLELEEVKDLLHDEAAKGPEVFEALGMKFPAGQVTLWGILLLLSIQLYFMTYLEQLRGKLQDDDAGWDVPWIGMNHSQMGKAIFFATVLPLPCGAILFLAARQLEVLSSLTSSNFNTPILDLLINLLEALIPNHWKSFVLLVAACCSSMWLAILSWKYRPAMVRKPQPKTFTWSKRAQHK